LNVGAALDLDRGAHGANFVLSVVASPGDVSGIHRIRAALIGIRPAALGEGVRSAGISGLGTLLSEFFLREGPSRRTFDLAERWGWPLVPRIYWTDVVEDRRHLPSIIFYPPMGVVPGPTIGFDQSPDLTFSQRLGSGLFLYHQTEI
jgi:hypothetical protein